MDILVQVASADDNDNKMRNARDRDRAGERESYRSRTCHREHNCLGLNDRFPVGPIPPRTRTKTGARTRWRGKREERTRWSKRRRKRKTAGEAINARAVGKERGRKGTGGGGGQCSFLANDKPRRFIALTGRDPLRNGARARATLSK